MAPPPVSETAATDEFLEHIRKYRDAYMVAAKSVQHRFAEERDEHWAWIVAEIRRLHADNERMEADLVAMAGAILEEQEDEWQSGAATRERETPEQSRAIVAFDRAVALAIEAVDDDSAEHFNVLRDLRSAFRAMVDARSTTSRSRVSDNG